MKIIYKLCIKTFESKISQNHLEDLEDFINANLAYLFDMGPIYSSYVMDKNKIKIEIIFYAGDLTYMWNDVKDYIIPFITRLDKEYKIHEIKAICSYYRYNRMSSHSILNKEDIIKKYS